MPKYSSRNFYLILPPNAFVRETEKAKCFLLNDVHIWLPKSQIVYEDDNSITIPEWLVIEKGLEIYADPDWIDAGEPD